MIMRKSSFAATVLGAAVSLSLLGAVPATAATVSVQDAPVQADSYPYLHSSYNTKFECQYQAWIASSRFLDVECRAVRDGAYHTRYQLWVLGD